MITKSRKRFFKSWSSQVQYLPFSSKFFDVTKTFLPINFFEISKKEITCINYNKFRLLFVKKDLMYFEFARKVEINFSYRPDFTRDWFYIKKLLRSKFFFSTYFLHLSTRFQRIILKLPKVHRSIYAQASWYKFSRDLACYSLLSSKKKSRRLFLKKNFLAYAKVRLKFKYDLMTLLSTKVVAPRWRFRSLLFQQNFFSYRKMVHQQKVLKRFAYKFLFAFVFRKLNRQIKSQYKKNRLLQFFITYVKFRRTRAYQKFRRLNRPLLVWFRKVFSKDVEKVLHRGISLRKFKVLPQLDRTREDNWWQRMRATYPIHKSRIKRHFSLNYVRRLKNVYRKIRRIRTLPQQISLRSPVKPVLLRWSKNIKNLSLNSLLTGYLKRRPQIYTPHTVHGLRSHQILSAPAATLSILRYPVDILPDQVLTSENRIQLTNWNTLRVGYLRGSLKKITLHPWLFCRIQKSLKVLKLAKVYSKWKLRRKKSKIWKLNKLIPKGFFKKKLKRSNKNFSKTLRGKKYPLIHYNKRNNTTSNTFKPKLLTLRERKTLYSVTSTKMKTNNLKPPQLPRRFISYRYTSVKTTKNVFLSKLWLEALQLFNNVKVSATWTSEMVFKIQYFIKVLSGIDQSCSYPYFFSYDNVTLASSSYELAELFVVFEHVICFFSRSVVILKKHCKNKSNPVFLKPERFARYRPNRKAQHLVDLTNEFYWSKSSKKFLTRKSFFVAPGLKKLFRVLTQNSYFHKPNAPGTALLTRKNLILSKTPFNNRIRYLFHRVHNINVFNYSKLRLDMFSRKPVIASIAGSGCYRIATKQTSMNLGVYIPLLFDNSFARYKAYHPWMTLIDRKKLWSKFLRVPRFILQDFRYYKSRLLPSQHKKILLVVDPYHDLIYYINLPSIKFIEFTISASLLNISEQPSRTYYINPRMRLKRTHFFRLTLGKPPLLENQEYLFSQHVPLLKFANKRLSDLKQKIYPKALLIDNFENRLVYWKSRLFIPTNIKPKTVFKKRPIKISRKFFYWNAKLVSFFTRLCNLRMTTDKQIFRFSRLNICTLTNRLKNLRGRHRRQTIKFFSYDVQSFKWKFFNRKWYQLYSRWKRAQAFRPLIKQAWSSYRKLSKNFLFIKLFKVHLKYAFGLSDKALWNLWKSVRRGNNMVAGSSFVEHFALTLHLKLDGLVLFLGLAPNRPIAQELVLCGGLRINGFVLTNYNWMLSLHDIIQVDLKVWENVKSLFSLSHWDKIKYRLKFSSFLYPCWPIMLFIFMKWPRKHEVVEESMMTERWVRYYIRYFPIKVSKYRQPKIEWLKY